MSDASDVSSGMVDDIAAVVSALLDAAPDLSPDQIMVVGAYCRDLHHHALGHAFPTTATSDIDLGIALSDWRAFEAVSERFEHLGDSGIRFRIAGHPVDVMPFGDVEDPSGVATPASRGEAMSVWAFGAVHAAASLLPVDESCSVTLPTVPGYAALKACAWLDRGAAKDATDLALALFWYAQSNVVRDQLYLATTDSDPLIVEGFDVDRAAARQLGRVIAVIVGSEGARELVERFTTAVRANVVREMRLRTLSWPADKAKGVGLLDSLIAGLAATR